MSNCRKRLRPQDTNDGVLEQSITKAVPASRQHHLALAATPSASTPDSSQSDSDEGESSEYSQKNEGQAHEHLPLGELAGAISQRKVGRKALKSAGKEPADDDSRLPKKRLNKHAPVEERIYQKPVSVLRDSVQRKNFKPKDPRFLPYLKSNDPREQDFANRRYSFLYEDAIPSEVKELKVQIKKAKTPHEKRKAQMRLSRLQETLKRHDDRRLEQEVEDEWKKQEKAKIEAGKNPYYLKASEKKKRVLEKKFVRLEETGQLEKYMSKKRKRQASKMHKKLPERRQLAD